MNRLLLLIIAFTGYTSALAQGPSNLYAQAKRDYSMGQFTAARNGVERVLTNNPDDPYALKLKGDCLQKLGKFKQSIKYYNNALEVRGEYPEALAHRGAAKANSGDVDGGLDDLNRSIKMNHSYSRAYYFRGNALYYNFKLNKAKKDYEACVELEQSYMPAHYMLAAIAAENKHYGAALEAYEQVLKLDPKMEEARVNQAGVLIKAGAHERALKKLQKVKPGRLEDSRDYLFYMGEALYFSGKQEEACGYYKKAEIAGDQQAGEIYKSYCLSKEEREGPAEREISKIKL